MSKTRWGNVFRILGALPIVGLIAGASFAENSGPMISGYIDTSYNYNFSDPKGGQTALRSYDKQTNTISLNNAHLAFMGTLGEVGYVVEVDAGTDAAINNVTSNPGATDNFDLQEAYMTYKPGKLGLKIGKFVTFNGIEVVESKDDPTISRGYLYNFAEPIGHTGGLVTYALSDKLDFAAGLVNGWDVNVDNNKAKTFVGKVGLNFGDPLALTLSGYHGAEQANTVSAGTTTANVTNDGNNRDTIDLTGVTKLLPRVALWFQLNYGQEENIYTDPNSGNLELATWSGAGIQPVISLTDKFSVGARLEYFADPQGVRTATGFTDVYTTNFTVTPGYKLTDNMTVRAEYRYDTANQKIWEDDMGVAKDNTSTGSVEFIVTF